MHEFGALFSLVQSFDPSSFGFYFMQACTPEAVEISHRDLTDENDEPLRPVEGCESTRMPVPLTAPTRACNM
jgi:hypothetical protein